MTGASGEEYVIEFSDVTGSEVVVMTESKLVPEETVVTVEDGSITTIVVGTDTYTVSYDGDGEVDEVTLVSGSAATTRRTQQANVADRRLQSCEDSCQDNSNAICQALEAACADISSVVYALLGTLCNDLDSLCEPSGIVQGCDEQCGPCECSKRKTRREFTLFFPRAPIV